MRTFAFAVCVSAAAASGVTAAPLLPISYSTLNGETGSYEYWDESYSGSGSPLVSQSPLSGGLGDLTDGIIASDNWFVVEQPLGPGPYVAWQNINPVITFNFAPGTIVDALTIYVDDANGAGGVSTPGSAEINGVVHALMDGVSGAPISFTFSNLNSTGALTLRLNDGTDPWVFLSEVTFDGRTVGVPEPSTIALLSLAAIAWFFRRQRASR